MEKNFIGQATPEQIAEWKKKYGEIVSFEVENHVGYFKHADRNTLSLAANKLKSSGITAYAEVIFENCFIGGSDEIQKDDRLFFGFTDVCDELFAKKKGTLKAL